MNASSPAARVRQGGALAMIAALTIVLFTALLALSPTTPDAAAEVGSDSCYDTVAGASFAADDCDRNPCDRARASAVDRCIKRIPDCYTDMYGSVEALESRGCDETMEEPSVEPEPSAEPESTPTPVPAKPAPTSAPVIAGTPTPTPQPPPPPIIGPITTGPIEGFLSAQLVGRQLTITVPGELEVHLQPAVYINAGGAFHAGPLPADNQVTLTVRPGTEPITIVLKGVVWTGASYTETLVIPR